MSTKFVLLVMCYAFGMVVVVVAQPEPKWFTDAAQSTGKAYREALTNVFATKDALKQLDGLIEVEKADNVNTRQARILIARLQYPEVFADHAEVIQKWRKALPKGERPGFLSGMLLQFTKQGPESRYVEEYERDVNGNIRVSEFGNTNNAVKLRGVRTVRKKVEKYTDVEVLAGIARNAAARQAIMEHFIKFLDEGNAYEQSEIVDVVGRLWGSMSSGGRRKDEPLADDLIEAVYRDESRPLLVRYRAGLSLPETRQKGMQGLMLNIATNTMNTSEDLVNRALYYLESSADAGTLAILKSQTNGPAWKRDKIECAAKAIEVRLSGRPRE